MSCYDFGDEELDSYQEERPEDYLTEEDAEYGVKTLTVEAGHFMFWPCKCGHIFGRHGGELFSGKMTKCFECDCKKFFPAQSLDKWRGKQKLTPTLEAWYKSLENNPKEEEKTNV